jgi:Spy/CpxP family protein refolding chaperone
MKRTKASIIAAGVLLAAATATGMAYAYDDYPGPHHMGRGYGWMGDNPPFYGPHGRHGMDHNLSYLADELDLSKDQRKSIRDITDKARSKSRELGESMIENREQMDDVMEDKGYGADFDKLARRQGDLIGQMIILRASIRAQIEGVLTAEQKEKFRDYDGDFCDRGPGRGW